MLAVWSTFLLLFRFAATTASASASSNGTLSTNATFDYVIVGGGTAGLTLAARLAESSLRVAVVEAGGYYEAENGNLSTVPGYCTVGAGTDPQTPKSKVDWGFVTTPQEGANGRTLHYARGKTLGGSSASNFMYYHRQTVGSSKKWADDVGDSSYEFSNLLPYYEKGVQYNAPDIAYPNSTVLQSTSSFDPAGGPLQVSFGRYDDPFATWALPALEKLGQPQIDGLQNGNLIGSSYVLETNDPKNSTRSSSESSYLQSALKKFPLKVYKNHLVEKILFEGDTASGVSVTSVDGKATFTLRAREEVIVSAGAFQSPQLLMVSGIGPRQTLEDLKIPIVKELPGVGQNLWDHAWFGSSFRVNIQTNSAGLNSPALQAAAVEAYLTQASGPLSVSGTGVLGWEKLPPDVRSKLSASTLAALQTFPSDWPELEFLPASGIIGNQSNYQTADPVDGYNYATMATALVAPLSRGNITINSVSMSDPPLINPNWITDPADQEVAIAAFKRQRAVWSFMSNITIGEEYFPGPSVQTDEQILNWLRNTLAPVWHAAATCKMGKEDDAMAVVDASAKVFGVKRLRVVDASAFPFLPPGHPQATVYAFAEKIADEIKRNQNPSVEPRIS